MTPLPHLMVNDIRLKSKPKQTTTEASRLFESNSPEVSRFCSWFERRIFVFVKFGDRLFSPPPPQIFSYPSTPFFHITSLRNHFSQAHLIQLKLASVIANAFTFASRLRAIRSRLVGFNLDLFLNSILSCLCKRTEHQLLSQ